MQKFAFPADGFLQAEFKYDRFSLCDTDLCNRNDSNI